MSSKEIYFCDLNELIKDKFIIKNIEGRSLGATLVNNEYKVILNICPHEGAELCKGVIKNTITSDKVGEFTLNPKKKLIVCPWHRWEFDLTTGKSLLNIPEKIIMFETFIKKNKLYFKL